MTQILLLSFNSISTINIFCSITQKCKDRLALCLWQKSKRSWRSFLQTGWGPTLTTVHTRTPTGFLLLVAFGTAGGAGSPGDSSLLYFLYFLIILALVTIYIFIWTKRHQFRQEEGQKKRQKRKRDQSREQLPNSDIWDGICENWSQIFTCAALISVNYRNVSFHWCEKAFFFFLSIFVFIH